MDKNIMPSYGTISDLEQKTPKGIKGVMSALAFYFMLKMGMDVTKAQNISETSTEEKTYEESFKFLTLSEIEEIVAKLPDGQKQEFYRRLSLPPGAHPKKFHALVVDSYKLGETLTTEQENDLRTRLAKQEDWSQNKIDAFIKALKERKTASRGTMDNKSAVTLMFGENSLFTGEYQYDPQSKKYPEAYTEKTFGVVRIYFTWVEDDGKEDSAVAFIADPCGNPGTEKIKQGILGIMVTVREHTKETITRTVTNEVRVEVPVYPNPNWEFNVQNGPETKIETASNGFNLYAAVSSFSQADANGLYHVEVSGAMTDVDADIDQGDVRAEWTVAGRTVPAMSGSLDLPAGTYDFTLTIYVDGKMRAQRVVQCRVPGNAAPPSTREEWDEQSADIQNTIIVEVMRRFKNGDIGFRVSPNQAGLIIGFSKRGEHVGVGARFVPAYNFDLQEIVLQNGTLWVTVDGKLFGIGLSLDYQKIVLENFETSLATLTAAARYKISRNVTLELGASCSQPGGDFSEFGVEGPMINAHGKLRVFFGGKDYEHRKRPRQ